MSDLAQHNSDAYAHGLLRDAVLHEVGLLANQLRADTMEREAYFNRQLELRDQEAREISKRLSILEVWRQRTIGALGVLTCGGLLEFAHIVGIIK